MEESSGNESDSTMLSNYRENDKEVNGKHIHFGFMWLQYKKIITYWFIYIIVT